MTGADSYLAVVAGLRTLVFYENAKRFDRSPELPALAAAEEAAGETGQHG